MLQFWNEFCQKGFISFDNDSDLLLWRVHVKKCMIHVEYVQHEHDLGVVGVPFLQDQLPVVIAYVLNEAQFLFVVNKQAIFCVVWAFDLYQVGGVACFDHTIRAAAQPGLFWVYYKPDLSENIEQLVMFYSVYTKLYLVNGSSQGLCKRSSCCCFCISS